jgi:predicted NBD/HSP70 family sugar kinase
VTRTQLTRSAIRGLIGELAAAGLVREQAAPRLGRPGRPSPMVRLDPDAALVLALEIAVDSLAVAIIGLGGHVFELVRVDRDRGHASLDETVAELARLANGIRARHPHDGALIGIGVAIVGVVRRTDGVVSMAPNLGWRDAPLGDCLAAALGPDVPMYVANEADLGALAELRRGAAVGESNIIFLSGEVGVGGGFIVDGKPLTGVDGYAGEVGHMPVNPDGRPCRCGSYGCWETEIGEDALLMLAGHTGPGGREAVDLVLRRASEGDATAISALEHVGRWLGAGLAGLVNVLNPRLIVLGGQFGRIYWRVLPALQAELRRRSLEASLAIVAIVPSNLGMNAPLLGAAELAFESLLADPARWLNRADESRSAATA